MQLQINTLMTRFYFLITGNFTIESEMARAGFERRVTEKAEAARNVLSLLPTWMWKCDPPQAKYQENETFIQFTELLQVM